MGGTLWYVAADGAITNDTSSAPPKLLLSRGRAVVTDVEGSVPAYAPAQRRYGGKERAAVLAEVDRPGTRMARIAVRPA